MPFVVKADAADLPWVKAILAKEAVHASMPENIGVGHWTAEEWQDLEASARSRQQQQQQQQQQRRDDEVPAYLKLPLGELETFMETFCADKAWKARKDFLWQYGTYVGYEHLADEEFVRAYEEAAVTKNAVLAAARALRAERKSELDVSSRIPSPGKAHVRDRLQVPPEIFGSCSKQVPLQDGPEGKAEVEREPSPQVQQQQQQQQRPLPLQPAQATRSPPPPPPQQPPQQHKEQLRQVPQELAVEQGKVMGTSKETFARGGEKQEGSEEQCVRQMQQQQQQQQLQPTAPRPPWPPPQLPSWEMTKAESREEPSAGLHGPTARLDCSSCSALEKNATTILNEQEEALGGEAEAPVPPSLPPPPAPPPLEPAPPPRPPPHRRLALPPPLKVSCDPARRLGGETPDPQNGDAQRGRKQQCATTDDQQLQQEQEQQQGRKMARESARQHHPLRGAGRFEMDAGKCWSWGGDGFAPFAPD